MPNILFSILIGVFLFSASVEMIVLGFSDYQIEKENVFKIHSSFFRFVQQINSRR